MKWQCIETEESPAQQIMDFDSYLLGRITFPTLHFYQWQGDSATYGHFIRPELFFNLERSKVKGLNLAKRPTGGGILFHLWDFAFSVLIPNSHPKYSLNTLENYAWINQIVVEAISSGTSHLFDLLPRQPFNKNITSQNFCYAHPTQYDIILNGKKIGGAAQRRTKNGFLHQGSISLVPPDEEYLRNVLIDGASVVPEMLTNSAYLTTHDNLIEMRSFLKNSLTNHFLE